MIHRTQIEKHTTHYFPPAPASIVALIVALILGACASSPFDLGSVSGDDVNDPELSPDEEVLLWRSERLSKLTSAYDWLSLTGMFWLRDGVQTVGAAPSSDIRLAGGPPELGVITVKDGQVWFKAAPDSVITLVDNADSLVDEVKLELDPPTKLQFGSRRLYAMDRGDLAIRVKDANAPSRLNFAGIEYYEINPQWRIDARFEPHPPGQEMEMPNVVGQVNLMINPGQIIFDHGGHEVRLEALDEEGDGARLFVVFSDRTNRDETYGGGRMLYVDWPTDGRVTIDFNQAYNPPCAFTEYSTCPLPPSANRLDAYVRAGEKRYEPGATGL